MSAALWLRGSPCSALAGCRVAGMWTKRSPSWHLVGLREWPGALIAGAALTRQPVGWVSPPRLEFGKGTSKAEIIPIWLLNQIFLECIICHQLENSLLKRHLHARSVFCGRVVLKVGYGCPEAPCGGQARDERAFMEKGSGRGLGASVSVPQQKPLSSLLRTPLPSTGW